MRLVRLLPLFVVLLIVSCFSAQAERPVDEPKASSGQAQDATATPAESPGPRSESSFKAEIAGRVLPAELELASDGPHAMVALPKTEDFEGSWPNDWQLLATEPKWWGPNECLAFGGSYDGWPARFDGTGYCSHTNPPACTIPSGYPLNFESVMVYGPFSTVGATSGAVDFKALIDTENNYDWAGVIAKTGSDCTDFPGTYNGPIRSGDWGGWIDWSEDLADFSGVGNLLGQANVCIAFWFYSDVIISDYPGFFLDNIEISIDTGPPVPIPNAYFADAITIPAKDYTNSQPTCGATTEPDEPTCGCGSIEDTVWYKFHETTTQPVVADTFGSDYDTELRVYSGPDPATFADLTCICCNDDTGGLQSECSFTAEAGTTYYFQIDGFGGDCGNLVFNLDEEEQGCWTGLPPAAAAAHVPALEPSSEEGEDIGVREGTPPTAADQAVPGELIVKFAPGVSRSAGKAVVRHEGAALSRHLLVPGYALVRVPPGKEEQFLARLEANPNVEMAERNGVMQATFVPNDEYYPYQWHMPQIQMEQAWDVANGSGVVVAVIDTGVAYENYDGFAQAPDLAGTSFTPGCDFVNRDYHANDDHGHGTHVTGTVAQTTNNTIGVAGVAYGATIMPIKVLDNAGSGTDADVADGITWAADYGADVINLSLGGGYSSVVETAINYALSNGVVVVAASGNENEPSLGCPACYAGVIAVGATDYNRNRAPYSNYGCGVGGHCLDVVAPGGDTGVDENGDTYADGVLQQTFEFACLGGPLDFTQFVYCFFQGTSMASPHVAGAAALLLDANPGLTVQQVGDCLRDTALDRGDPGYDLEYGYGLIQVRDALDSCELVPDADGDTVPDDVDNCPETYDTGNGDNDGDGIPGTQPPSGATWGGDVCDADDDNDVMPDTYEDAYVCLDPLLADGVENADGDELRNYPEMVVATDPCVANPELALDSDEDGGSDGRERYIGTDPQDDCTNDGSPEERGTHDAWHFDINIDTWSDILDVLLYKGHLQIQYSEPDYLSRLDFNADGWVDILDILLYKGDLQIQCTNP